MPNLVRTKYRIVPEGIRFGIEYKTGWFWHTFIEPGYSTIHMKFDTRERAEQYILKLMDVERQCGHFETEDQTHARLNPPREYP